MIRQGDLVWHLERRNLGAWSVVERVQDIAIVDERRDLQRREHRTHFTVIVHHDVPLGRGTARLDIDARDGSPEDLVDQAVALALAAVGPAWLSAPPAAPAKVAVVDGDLVKRELDAVALATLANLRRPPGVTVTAAADVLREKVSVIASSGFRTTWLATSLRIDAVVALATAAAAPSFRVSRRARRLADLQLDDALAVAAADLQHFAGAGPPSPGGCALWLGPEALLHDGDRGLWSIFAHQADSAIERQGLTRLRYRGEIAAGAAKLAEPLSITSSGALDFAIRSRPVSDDAAAVRNFPLVERGVAIGLGLSPREAALRRTDPNGGVRNLVVAPGSWPATPSPTTRTVEVRRLRAVSVDLTTGDASLDIALGFDHRPGHPQPTPFTTGVIRLDLISDLARARRSTHQLQRGAYLGPSSILIDDAELIL